VGLDRPTEGEIFIAETPVHELKGADLVDFRLRNIGFVFQAYNLVPVLTARENVEFHYANAGNSCPQAF
jgi:putative ABC transport system ATP-binding protein